MPEQKRSTINLFGKEVSVTEVPIKTKSETYNEYVLEDGAVIRFAAVATAVFRVDDFWDAEGNPYYFVRNGTVVTPVNVPNELQRKQS